MMKVIQSKDNPRIRQLAKLSENPRETKKQGLALLDGVHLLSALLDSDRYPAWGVVTASALQRPEIFEAVNRAEKKGTEWFEVPEALLANSAPTEHPSGLLAVWSYLDSAQPDSLNAIFPKDECVLMLDDIQDPGNLGTLLRSAQASGIQYVALSEGCAEPWAPKVMRAAMGAHFHLKRIEKINLISLAASRSPCFAACGEAQQNVWDTDLSLARGIVIGNEGAGISPALRQACTEGVAIPMTAHCESLNAAIAGSVLMFERQRQLRVLAQSL